MLKKTDYSEKRQFGRRPAISQGWIKIAGRPAVPCTISDISEGGAALDCENGTWLPYNFRLVCEPLGIDRLCEIRNQRQNRFGIEFVENVKGTLSGRLSDDTSDWSSRSAPKPAPATFGRR